MNTLKFKGPSSLLTELPFWSKYTLSHAEKRTHCLVKDGEIISQLFHIDPPPGSRLINYSFSVDLIEIQQKTDALIQFSTDSRHIYICFVVNGNLAMRQADGVRPLRHNTFQFLSLASDVYGLELTAGYHAALVVSVQHEWLEEWFKDLKTIRTLVAEFIAEEQPFQASAPCTMGPIIRKWLSGIYNCQDFNLFYIDGNLKLTLTRIIYHYDKTIREGEVSLAEEVKLYIDENFCDPDLKVEMLAEKFNVTRQTLRNHFIKKYGVNVREYYIALRVEYVMELRKFRNVSLNDIYESVGYADVSSLRTAIKKQNNPPAEKKEITGKENNQKPPHI